jgi:hypothetical protein
MADPARGEEQEQRHKMPGSDDKQRRRATGSDSTDEV